MHTTLENFERIALRILKDIIEDNLDSKTIDEFDFEFNQKVLVDILIEEFAEEDFFDGELED